MKSPVVVDELSSVKENIKKGEEANRKPLIEILETYQDKPEYPNIEGKPESVQQKILEITTKQSEGILKPFENNDYQQPEGIVREGVTIIDHDKKLLRNLSNETYTETTSQQNENKKVENVGNPMKKIKILEIKATESKPIKTKQVSIKELSNTIPEENKHKEQIRKNIPVTEIPKSKENSEEKVKAEKGKDNGKGTKKGGKDSSKGNDAASASGSYGSGDSQQSSEC